MSSLTRSSVILVALDGLSGSGKGTIGPLLAKLLGVRYLDTGTLYRAAALLCRVLEIAIEDEERCVAVIQRTSFEVGSNGVVVRAAYTDEYGEVTVVDTSLADIRSAFADFGSSLISKYAGVRDVLNEYIRQYAYEQGCVVDGRDIGRVVLPDAQLKLFLAADAEIRARRRHVQKVSTGVASELDLATVADDLARRDYQDQNRAVAPAGMLAPDAVPIDCTFLTIEEVLALVTKLARDRQLI